MSSFPILYILAAFPVFSKAQEKKPCDVTTKSHFVELGSDVNISCLSACVQSETSWTLNGNAIGSSLSEAVNSSYTVLYLKNFTYESAIVQCHSILPDQVLGGANIRTYTKPSKVSCLLTRNMTSDGVLPNILSCQWEHKMNSSLKIAYTVHMTCAFCEPHKMEICTSETTSCVFKSVPLLRGNYSVIVRAFTSHWEVYSETYQFQPFHIWVIAPPEIQVAALSDHLLVELPRPLSFGHVGIRCQVKYRKSHDQGTTALVLNLSMNRTDREGKAAIEDIESCTDYTLSARWALDKAPWSSWSRETTLFSRLNKNTFKFNLWRKVTEPGNNGVRKVKAMWAETPSACKEKFTCYVDSILYDKHMYLSNDYLHRASVCHPSSCTIDVGQDAYEITLTVKQNGTQIAKESVYVPAIGESLPRVGRIDTSSQEGVVLVTWEAPPQPASGYVVDWTHDGTTYFWKRSKHTNATLRELEDFRQYNITVTPLFGKKTGLCGESLQVCSRKRALLAPTTDVQPKDTSALVRWDMTSQDSCSDVVLRFVVRYKTDNGPQHQMTVEGTKREALLENLKADTKYSMYVVAMGLTGNTSCIERHFETKRYDPRLILVFSICGAVGIFLILSLGICCICWCKKSSKRLPNPGLSSVALWPSQGHNKIIEQFKNPSESETVLVRVDHCEEDITSTSLLPSPGTPCSDDNLNPGSDSKGAAQSGSALTCSTTVESVVNRQGEEKNDLLPDPDSLPAEAAASQEDPSASLLSGGGPPNPYRSQASLPLAQRSGDGCRRLPRNKQPTRTVYVTLDMWQGQRR